jgi:hypothetical protein
MAFTNTIDGETHIGGKRLAWGTWTTDTTTGAIKTGLSTIYGMTLTPNSAAVVADECAVNATFPVVDSITISITSGVDGYWTAIGE